MFDFFVFEKLSYFTNPPKDTMPISKQPNTTETLKRKSSVRNSYNREMNHEMEPEEIRDMIDLYPEIAALFQKTGNVHLLNIMSGEGRVMEDIDTIVIANDHTVCYELFGELEDTVKELYSVGNCVTPLKIGAVILAGYRVGRHI